MSRLRVNSGTACDGITQERAAPFHLFCVLGVRHSQCRAQTPPSWLSMSSGGGVPCHKYLDRGRLPSRDQIIFSLPRAWASRCATNFDGVLPSRRVWIAGLGDVGAQDVASIENEPDRIVYCCERGAQGDGGERSAADRRRSR